MKKTYINPECVAHKVDTILPIALSNLQNKRPSNDDDLNNQFVKEGDAWDDQW